MVAALNLGSASPFLGSNSPSKPKVIQTNLSNASPQVANLTITKTNSNSSVVTPVNQQVSDVLSNIAGTNAQIDNFSHIDWSSIARESGAQVANQDRLGLLQAIRGSEIADAVDSSRLGLPANVTILPNGRLPLPYPNHNSQRCHIQRWRLNLQRNAFPGWNTYRHKGRSSLGHLATEQPESSTVRRQRRSQCCLTNPKFRRKVYSRKFA